MERASAGARRTGTFSYGKGEQVFAAGRGAGLVFIVRSGCVRLVKIVPDGRPLTLGFLGPHAVYAQEAGDPVSAEVAAIAVVDSTVTAVAPDNLAALIAVSPALAASVVARSARRSAEPRTVLDPSLIQDLPRRLAATLLELAEAAGRPAEQGWITVDLPITDGDVAELVGTDPRTLGWLLDDLDAAGLVRSLGPGRFTVAPDGLRRRATAPEPGAPPVSRDLPSQEWLLEALRESETRFHVVWNQSSDAIALSDPEGIVLAANPAYAELYGYPLDQVVGRSFAIIFPPEERAWAIEQYQAAFDGPLYPPPFETTVRRADGTNRQVVARVGFVQRGDERVAMVSVIRELDEQRPAERRSA